MADARVTLICISVFQDSLGHIRTYLRLSRLFFLEPPWGPIVTPTLLRFLPFRATTIYYMPVHDLLSSCDIDYQTPRTNPSEHFNIYQM